MVHPNHLNSRSHLLNNSHYNSISSTTISINNSNINLSNSKDKEEAVAVEVVNRLNLIVDFRTIT